MGPTYPTYRLTHQPSPTQLNRHCPEGALRQLADVVGALPEVMRDSGVPDLVIERSEERIGRVARALSKVLT